MQKSIRNSYQQNSANTYDGTHFTSYYTRPSVILPRNSARSFLDVPTNKSFIATDLSTSNYSTNMQYSDINELGYPQMKSSMITRTPKISEKNYKPFYFTPNMVLHIKEQPRQSHKTDISERTTISRTNRTVNYEDELLRENDQLKEENRLLREQVEYLRTKYTKTLIRKYRPGRKELFD